MEPSQTPPEPKPESKKEPVQSKSWVFTLNNPTEDNIKFLEAIEVNRIAVGEEIAPSTGTKHLQGFITFKRAYRLAQLKKLLPTAHWEKARVSDAANYCLKEKILINKDNSKPGKRSDIEEFMKDIKAGKRPIELMEEHPTCMAKYEGLYKRYKSELRKYDGQRIVLWVYGAPGTGKTKTFHDHFSPPDARSVTFKNEFVIGYSGEQYVLIDDFRPKSTHLDEFLRITDRYPYIVNVKHGEVNWNAKLIYITAPTDPELAFTEKHTENMGQVLRRLRGVYKLPEDQVRLNEDLVKYKEEIKLFGTFDVLSPGT